MSTDSSQSSGSAPTVAPSARLLSLDALRGFTMMWIVGADALGGALSRLQGGPLARIGAYELSHSVWEGFRFYDLIFPLFVFMMGVAITFSLGRRLEGDGRRAVILRIVRRAVLLYALGLFYYGGLATPVSQFRLMGVLQRLAFCYLFASLLFLYLRPPGLVAALLTLLVGYWALMRWVPVPGFGAGDWTEGHNLANWLDRIYLGGRKHDGDHDVEGLLSTLPAIASCLLGVLAGLWLRGAGPSSRRKAALLATVGAVVVAAGWAWGLEFPVIKKLWTSSYVLVAGGWSALLLAGFYYLIDVVGWRRWAQPLVWFGTNALTIYLISNLVDFRAFSARLAGGDVAAWLNGLWPGLGGLVLAVTSIALCAAICRFLYQRKIFLRL